MEDPSKIAAETVPAPDPEKKPGLFEPGGPGGPGRPSGSRNKATLALDKIAADAGEDILNAMAMAAKDGDLRAADLVLQRIWPARKSRPIALTLPAIQSASMSSRLSALWPMPWASVTSLRTKARPWLRFWRPNEGPSRQWIWKRASRRWNRSGNDDRLIEQASFEIE